MAALYPSWLSTLNRETLHEYCLFFDDLLLVKYKVASPHQRDADPTFHIGADPD